MGVGCVPIKSLSLPGTGKVVVFDHLPGMLAFGVNLFFFPSTPVS